jgi:Fur family transcriptional regulator, ferric uptake regulator
MILTKERRMGRTLGRQPACGGAGGVAFGAGRSTPQRRAVADAAAAFAGAFTADDLAAGVRRDAPGVSTATVYRSIAAMVASRYLTEVGEREGAALYARCAEAGHHHHVVCTGCGATAHAPCPVDASGLAALAPAGFVVTSHELRLYGLCATCADLARDADGCSCDGAEAPVDAAGRG